MEDILRARVRRFVFWQYPRASWPYEILVILILAFIFLTPREWFRDQPRPSNIVLIEGSEGVGVVWIAPELLAGVPEARRYAAASGLIQGKFGRKLNLVRVDPISDPESEIQGYLALTKP
jgi:hypothetical protein